MSYADPRTRVYSYNAIDMGAGDKTRVIKGPAGKKGRLVDIYGSITEAFNATTTSGKIRVGTAADPDAYAEFDMATLAADTGFSLADDTDAIISADIPADTPVHVDFVAPTGGTPTGIADVFVAIDWAW